MTAIFRFTAAAALVAGIALPAAAGETSATIRAVDQNGVGDPVGEIYFSDSEHGLLIEPELAGVAPGLHGLHVHQNADCGPSTGDDGEVVAGGKAGGHYDPEGTGTHEGPYGSGHLGDLPNLVVLEDGTSTLTLLAPRVTVADLDGRAIMVHAEGDDYSDDHPGGGRAWCGIVK